MESCSIEKKTEQKSSEHSTYKTTFSFKHFCNYF